MKKSSIKMMLAGLGVIVALGSGCGKSAENKNLEQPDNVEEAIVDENQEEETVTEESQIEQSPTEAEDAEDAEQSVEEQTESEGAENTSDEIQADLFMGFLNNGGSLQVSDVFQHDNRMVEREYQPGNTFTLESLKTYLQEDAGLSGVEPQIEYAYLDYPDRKAYALSFYFDTNLEGITQIYILSEANEHLEMNFAIDGWSRRGAVVNENGVIFDGGSNGAGAHGYTTYVPDEKFEYKVLSDREENAYGYWFYDSNGEPIQVINDIMTEAAEGNPDAEYILYSQVAVDGRTYYYFLGVDKITQALVDYIDGIAQEHNFVFDGKAAVMEAEQAYAEKLGADGIYNNEKLAEWISVSE